MMSQDAPWLPKRYVILFLVGLGMMVIHAMRINIGLTVVALVDPEHDAEPLNKDNKVGTTSPLLFLNFSDS